MSTPDIEVACPQCNGTMEGEYESGTGEAWFLCSQCGYYWRRDCIQDRTPGGDIQEAGYRRFKLRKDGSRIYRTRFVESYGFSAIHFNSSRRDRVSARFDHFRKPVTDKDVEQWQRKMLDPTVDCHLSYLTSFDPITSKVTVLYGLDAFNLMLQDSTLRYRC